MDIFSNQLILFYSNNATNLHHLTPHSMPHCPQHRDHDITTDYCDITSPYVRCIHSSKRTRIIWEAFISSFPRCMPDSWHQLLNASRALLTAVLTSFASQLLIIASTLPAHSTTDSGYQWVPPTSDVWCATTLKTWPGLWLFQVIGQTRPNLWVPTERVNILKSNGFSFLGTFFLHQTFIAAATPEHH